MSDPTSSHIHINFIICARLTATHSRSSSSSIGQRRRTTTIVYFLWATGNFGLKIRFDSRSRAFAARWSMFDTRKIEWKVLVLFSVVSCVCVRLSFTAKFETLFFRIEIWFRLVFRCIETYVLTDTSYANTMRRNENNDKRNTIQRQRRGRERDRDRERQQQKTKPNTKSLTNDSDWCIQVQVVTCPLHRYVYFGLHPLKILSQWRR